ncbi:DEAD/DEAH box helicase family protein [uncultured Dialister sp.]|uniref:type I restriction endonuclease n=1 Tax=uncultured Dialister sp. TaxID=278064 RepID=UPI00265EFEC6|nr:DEAD/DEAH box helicase family protein [uncultured Dialister sp.]
MAKSKYNENSRVKIPALIHLTRLGYQYVSLKQLSSESKKLKKDYMDSDTNILLKPFKEALIKINNRKFTDDEILHLIKDLKEILNQDDLGRNFYHILLNGYEGIKLIDWNPKTWCSNNIFQIVTEYTYENKDADDSFRPDITLLINGMPISFIEVKIPNNKEGIQAEYKRMNQRLQNRAFRRFTNITQLMIFSNNQEYDNLDRLNLQGAFYATTDHEKAFLNHFREEDQGIFTRINPIDNHIEDSILNDNNLISIKGTSEFNTNLSPMTPTNRILTSLLSMRRIWFLLRYGICYRQSLKDDVVHIEKHLMRYQQFFATLAIERSLDKHQQKGVIWHTQGSGKTELAFYNFHVLKSYFTRKGITPKFYFIVDRRDLLNQASNEFQFRGAAVAKVNSKSEFIKNIQSTATTDDKGNDVINVVNIQKFSEESITKPADYNVQIQRVYFLDEAHRSYNPTGSFLANLMNSDRNAIIIAMTGTPIIAKKYKTKEIFGPYIHTYYYNQSIEDGYTVRLMREAVSTEYRVKLKENYERLAKQSPQLSVKNLYAKYEYVRDLAQFIIQDFQESRIIEGDQSIGGMIVAHSSDQARAIFEELQRNYPSLKSILILHDEDNERIRKNEISDFKNGNVDILVVFNMLLTGFDSPRLKKMYLCRMIKNHNLLQCLTRVNRPYKHMNFGYVVDFANIQDEFDKTNREYFKELQVELGDEFEHYTELFVSHEEVEKKLKSTQSTLEEKLFEFDTSNKEIFSQQIDKVQDKKLLQDINHALKDMNDLYHVSKLFGYDDLASKFSSLSEMKEIQKLIQHRLDMLNTKDALNNQMDLNDLLNLSLESLEFNFHKISSNELGIVGDNFHKALKKARIELGKNQDNKDPEFITLADALRNVFAKQNIEESTEEEMRVNIGELQRIYNATYQLNQKNNLIAAKYNGDEKFMRAHKRVLEAHIIDSKVVLNRVLMVLKNSLDQEIGSNEHILENEAYFERTMLPVLVKTLDKNNIDLESSQIQKLGHIVAKEYYDERKWTN